MHSIRVLADADSDHVRSAQAITSVAHACEELVLNSLDAGATEVMAVLDVSGFSMSVRDNGHGMSAEALSMVGDRHATSKLRTFDELQDGLPTFGYRGQALHALAVTSLVEIVSRRAGAPASATNTTVLHQGRRLHVGPAQEARAPGTTISIRDMLVSRPVQRKRLQRAGAAQAELEAARSRLVRLAVAHPHVAFRLHDASRGATVLHATPTADPLTSLSRLMGSSGGRLPPMAPLRFDDGEYTLEGHVALPPAAHHSRELQLIYVNGRPLARRSELPQLIETAWGKLLSATASAPAAAAAAAAASYGASSDGGTGRGGGVGGGFAERVAASDAPAAQAAFVLFVRCAPTLVDATLEPDRTDVLFADFGSVAAAALAALAHCFSAHSALLAPEAVARLLSPLAPGGARQLRGGGAGRAHACAVDAAAAAPQLSGGFAWAHTDPDEDAGGDGDMDGWDGMHGGGGEGRDGDLATAASLLEYGDTPPMRRERPAALAVAEQVSHGGGGGDLGRAVPRVPLSITWPALHAAHNAVNGGGGGAGGGDGRRVGKRRAEAAGAEAGLTEPRKRVVAARRSTPKPEREGAAAAWAVDAQVQDAAAEEADASAGGQAAEAAETVAAAAWASAWAPTDGGSETEQEVVMLAESSESDGGGGEAEGEAEAEAEGEGEGEDEGEVEGAAASSSLFDVAPEMAKLLRASRPRDSRPPNAAPAAPSAAPDDANAGGGGGPRREQVVMSKQLVGQMVAIGQLERTWVAVRAAGALYALDPHAADERVQLERLSARAIDRATGLPRGSSDACSSHRLRQPKTLTLTPRELALLRAHGARVAAWGWDAAPNPAEAALGVVALRAVPLLLNEQLGGGALLEYLHALEETGGGSTQPPPAAQRVLASKACRRAVMFGTRLDVADAQRILAELARCELPFQCAHGRPTLAPLARLDALPVPEE